MRITVSEINELITGALRQSEHSDLPRTLEQIAKIMETDGCILWKVAPEEVEESNGPSGPSARYLFMLAEWFVNEQRCSLHNVDLNKSSLAGTAIATNQILESPDIWQDERVYKDHPFLQQANIKTMCSAPIAFKNGAEHGAVNLYRTESRPFEKEELEKVKDLALLLPAIYQIISEKESLLLIRGVNDELHQAETGVDTDSSEVLSKEAVCEMLLRICKLISESFDCLETSLFLEDRIDSPDVFELLATTWPGVLKKKSYKGTINEGLTSWVLHHAEPLTVFNLDRFNLNKKALRKHYRGLKWRYKDKLEEVARTYLNLEPDQSLPPMSFMAVPIMKGKNVRGAIRCSVPRKGSSHFTERELEVLKLIAAQVGRFWSNWLGLRRTQEENKSWRGLVDSINRLNDFVSKESRLPKPSVNRIYAEALHNTEAVLGQADIMDVRLLDENTSELYFVEPHGEAWKRGTPEEVAERRGRRFDVKKKPPTSAGALVFQTGKSHEVKDTSQDQYYAQTFPNVKRMIVAPIKVSDKTYGVLDFRGTKQRDFPQHALAIAELLGQQLGIYTYLADTIGELRRAQAALNEEKANLEKERTITLQTFQDLAHQFKTPIITAQSMVQRALDHRSTDDSLRSILWMVRGLCGKAKRVSYNTTLFKALAQNEPIVIDSQALIGIRYEDLMKLLKEASHDNQQLSRYRHIGFFVDEDTFAKTSLRNARMQLLEVDRNLLEQALTDLLDNAAKYSYENTRVRIHGGRTGTGGFYISVENRGIPIRRDDVDWCVQRGWQSDAAKYVSSQGSGIGLWIVDEIMKAHDGKLTITPTTPDGLTNVRLIFPSSKVK